MIRSCLFGVLLLLLAECHPAKKTATSLPPSADTLVSSPPTPTTPITNTGRTDSLLDQFFVQNPELFDSVMQNRQNWNVQVIYTQIDRTEGNDPVFKDFYWNVDRNRYFYPSSLVGMPVALLALQKLKETNIPGLNRKTAMITEADYPGQAPTYNDPNTPDGIPNIEQYVKRVFLDGDAEAYNRLYEFVGPATINDKLRKMGYGDAQIRNRMNYTLADDENRHTNPIRFYDGSKIIYNQASAFDKEIFAARNDLLGKAFYNSGKLVSAPMDFSNKNRIGLEDLHNILKSILFPNAVSPSQRFNISSDDYRLVYKSISQYLFNADPKLAPVAALRVFNKEQDALGFLIDISYVIEFEQKVEFMLSTVIYCNEDDILNDGHYDYERIGYPFIRNLRNKIFQYELKRSRNHLPDLSEFRFDSQR